MMLPATTYANNQLPDYLITHGSAMISTARQFAGVVGVLVAQQLFQDLAMARQCLHRLCSWHGRDECDCLANYR